METENEDSKVISYLNYQNAIQYMNTWCGTTINMGDSVISIDEPITIKLDESELLGNKLKELKK